MQGNQQRRTPPLAVAVFALGLLSVNVFANQQPKTYPEVGKIVATGVKEKEVRRDVQYTNHTYTVVTESRSYLLECTPTNLSLLLGPVGRECGGRKKLQIGDVIHFRIVKDRVYIPITKSDNSVGEDRLSIISTALRSDAPDTPRAGPDKPDAKPPASN